MKVDIVIGANLGDEGKGTVVATCAKRSDGKVLNILTNGGAQRAHSILTEDGNFTFQHFGSGTYHGAYNYFSRYYILNPMQFTKEREELVTRGVIPVAYRDKKCRWSTPFDMMTNAIIENLRGDNKHGSCGMGIWETALRYQKTKTITFDSFMLLTDEKKVEYLISVRKYFEDNRICQEIPATWKDIWYNTNLIYHFIEDCWYLYNHTANAKDIKEAVKAENRDHLIFENGQGLLLSDTGKDIAGTTPSLTGSEYASELISEFGEHDRNNMEVNLHYVTRPYLTRHGRGYLNDEKNRSFISNGIQEDRTNHFNEFQEDFRYGELDTDMMCQMYKYIKLDSTCVGASKEGGFPNVIIDLTHCDEMDREAEFKKIYENVTTYDSPLIK